MAKSHDTTIGELVKEFDSLTTSDTTHQLKDQRRLMVRSLNSLIAKCSSKMYYRPTSGPHHPEIFKKLQLRTEHLTRLELGLLPSLRHRITALLLSLDPSDLRKDPTGKVKMVLGILSELEQTLDQIHASMDTIIPVPTIKPSDVTDDNHLKTLKAFRTSRLGMNADDLFKVVADLLGDCVSFIETWGQPSNKESQRRAHLLSMTSIFWNSIDMTIQWFGRSEFNLLQASWQSEVALVEDALDELLEMIKPVEPKEEEEEDDPPDATSSSGEDDTSEYEPVIRSDEVIQLAKVTIPLVKLSRLFLNKLSKTTVTKEQFGLATSEMSSSELENIVSLTRSISQCIDEIGDSLHDGENEMLVESGGHLGKSFKRILELLDLHLIPLIPHDDQAVDPKKWFSEWNKQFALALENYMSMAKVFPQKDS